MAFSHCSIHSSTQSCTLIMAFRPLVPKWPNICGGRNTWPSSKWSNSCSSSSIHFDHSSCPTVNSLASSSTWPCSMQAYSWGSLLHFTTMHILSNRKSQRPNPRKSWSITQTVVPITYHYLIWVLRSLFEGWLASDHGQCTGLSNRVRSCCCHRRRPEFEYFRWECIYPNCKTDPSPHNYIYQFLMKPSRFLTLFIIL